MLMAILRITKENTAIIGNIMFPQADSKYTESSAGKEEKQKESVLSIFKVNKVLKKLSV